MSTAEPPSSATATATSLLDKPLHQLTEDDISQVTREQCRKFLKNKGMRQPAWNKSKAVQQVILLKALLEPVPESEDGGRRPCITTFRQEQQQQQTPATRVQKGTSVDTEISLSAEESVPVHRNDTEKSDFVGDNDSAAPIGVGGVAEEAKRQMTIFYSGKVNVYDDIPADKARALLQLAASPLQFPQEAPFDGNIYQAPGINVGADFSAVVSPKLHTVRSADNHRLHREESNRLREENFGSASRKASVQRFREKQKDRRLKSKRKAGAPPCGTTIDVYLNHHIGTHNLHEQSSRSATCSPPPVRPPNTPNRFS